MYMDGEEETAPTTESPVEALANLMVAQASSSLLLRISLRSTEPLAVRWMSSC
jgi:hypothetical protein